MAFLKENEVNSKAKNYLFVAWSWNTLITGAWNKLISKLSNSGNYIYSLIYSNYMIFDHFKIFCLLTAPKQEVHGGSSRNSDGCNTVSIT